MEIPSYLINEIRQGNAVILLGAGASLDARDHNGSRPPTGRQLGELLSKRFLGGKFNDYPLNMIGEYAINEADTTTVQEYIRELFEDFEPTAAHRKLSLFNWHGIATVNYDRLIERAYEGAGKNAQRVKPLIRNGDRIDAALKDRRTVPLLKLHGCITRTSDLDCPLILTTDQYIEHMAGRSRIFRHLEEWGREHPVIYIGTSLQDPDLRAILLMLTKELKDARPRYYIVAPSYDDIEVRSWESKKITPLKFSFTSFMAELENAINTTLTSLAIVDDKPDLAILKELEDQYAPLSENCLQFLDSDAEYVRDIKSTRVADPKSFYKGSNQGWAAIEQELDIRRKVSDTIISDHVLINEADHAKSTEIILIKAHAGAGKSIALRRIAWDSTHLYEKLCLFMRPHGVVNVPALQELIARSNQRLYLFIDDAADRVREIRSLARLVGPEAGKLTVVLAERINEWNVGAESLSKHLTAEFELRYLAPKEIDLLLAQLEKHRALGTLEGASLEQRRIAFADHAGRQLLVALHEATLGRNFEEIIEDEFNHIYPYEAQRIYLSICVLNRLNVKVRAGIVSRLYGIRFEDFQKRFFAPLEHIVESEYDPVIRDYTYQARHPHIAEIVFLRVLKTSEERFNAYTDCLKQLIIDFDDDRRAYRQMTRGRSVIDLFPDHNQAKAIYEIAQNEIGSDAYLLHQMGIYEMNRVSGNLDVAEALLSEAQQISPNDLTIKHSIAEHRLRRAESARTDLLRQKYLREATQQSRAILSEHNDEVFPYATLIKVATSNLQSVLREHDSDSFSVIVQDAIRDVERRLLEAQQKFPGDAYLLDLEARVASLLSDNDRVLSALRQAFASSADNIYVAMRLARCYEGTGDSDEAISVIERAIAASPTERKLHYSYAKLLIKIGTASNEKLIYHLQRAFSPGDDNYDAQILYGRQLYVGGEVGESKEFFRVSGQARVSPQFREAIHYELSKSFTGTIERMEATYCFIARDGIADWIHCHRSNIVEEVWFQLTKDVRVNFSIGFNLRGPSGFDVALCSVR